MADGAPAGDDDLFGTRAQRALSARGPALFAVTSHDERYTCHGRTVGPAGPQGRAVETRAPSRVQGAADLGPPPGGRIRK